MKSDIAEVNINLIKPNNGLIGFASIVLNDQLYLSSIGIHQKLNGNGYRLTYPNRKVGNTAIDLFHPINKDLGLAIENAVVTKLKDVMKNDRYGCFDA